MKAGIFGVVPESEVFQVGSTLLLNGLFGVEKNEEAEGTPIYRLIMNLVPLNDICHGMRGGIHTLPHWFGMSLGDFKRRPAVFLLYSESATLLVPFPLLQQTPAS